MAPSLRRTLAATTVVAFAFLGAGAEQVLEEPGLKEHVKVERSQFEVIVWPPRNNVALCSALTKADFELSLNRHPFVDFEFDPLDLSDDASTQTPPEGAPAATVPAPPRFVALLFDWWGLGEQGDDEYTPRKRAFIQARAYIEAHPLDRFVILEVGDVASFRSTAFQTGIEAKATFDRFESETSARGFQILGQHLDMRGWRDALLDAVTRLGTMEPRQTKDLFVMTTDVFPESDVFHDDLRKLSTQYKVRVDSLDLAWDGRPLPFGLFAFSEAGGGVVFGNGNTLGSAIETLDRLRPCTYRITLPVPDSKRALPLSVSMRDARFRVTAPEAVGGRFDVVAAEHAELKNDFDNPTAEVGLRVTPELVRVAGGQRSTEYALTLRIEKSGELDPEEIGTLRVYGAVWNKLKPRTSMYADFSAFRITGDALRKIAGGGSETFRFPDTIAIPNREKSVSVIVSVHGPHDALSKASASRRIEVELPE